MIGGAAAELLADVDPGTSKSTDGEGAQSEGGVGELDTEMHGPDSEQPGHGGGGGRGVVNILPGLQGWGLIKGALYVMVREEWQEDQGFEVWELEENVGGRDALSDELLLTQVRGRRWVHNMTLVEKGAATEVASDLPDKPVGGGKLGKKGQRRFAPP